MSTTGVPLRRLLFFNYRRASRACRPNIGTEYASCSSYPQKNNESIVIGGSGNCRRPSGQLHVAQCSAITSRSKDTIFTSTESGVIHEREFQNTTIPSGEHRFMRLPFRATRRRKIVHRKNEPIQLGVLVRGCAVGRRHLLHTLLLRRRAIHDLSRPSPTRRKSTGWFGCGGDSCLTLHEACNNRPALTCIKGLCSLMFQADADDTKELWAKPLLETLCTRRIDFLRRLTFLSPPCGKA